MLTRSGCFTGCASSNTMKCKDVVIGYSLEAVCYSFVNDCHLIINSLRRPFEFDIIEDNENLKWLSTRNKLEAWSQVVLEQSLDGFCPFGSHVESIRIEDNTIKVVPESGTLIEIEFENCYIFEDENVTVPNELVKKRGDMYRVFDWMNVRTGTTHKFDTIETKDPFINKIHFYKSRRIDGQHNKKDLVAESFLANDQLEEFDFSETMAKFKIQSVMGAKGIRGSRSGISKNGKQVYYNVKIEPDYRYIEPLGKSKYKDSENVKFLDLSLDEI